jgi:hypothetical protein
MPPNFGKARPFNRLTALFTLCALVILFIEAHWSLWYYFDVDFDAQKGLAEAATGGAIGIIYGFLPDLNKRFIQIRFRRLLVSQLVFRVSVSTTLLICGFGLLINRTKIKWPVGEAGIRVDGQKLGTDSWASEAVHSASLYGSFFFERLLQVGDSSERLKFRPMVPLEYEISEEATYSSQSEYQHIVSLLALSFFQSTENQYLSEANNRFASDSAKKYVDLNLVYQILKICFNGDDVARSGDRLFELFREQHASSNWVPLLQSCLYYSGGISIRSPQSWSRCRRPLVHH